MSPRKIILKSMLSLGDIVCFTAAVGELHLQHPGMYLTDVRTPFPELWEHNPLITPLADDDPDAEIIEVHYHRDDYESVNWSNQHAVHLIEAYCQDLANSLRIGSLKPSRLNGDIYLSPYERGRKSLPHELSNVQRYWIVCAGGKSDYTVKHWPHESYQRVVDYFAGRIQFAQIGAAEDGHVHKPLNGVVNLVGKTSVRELVHTVHAASGVLCGITGVMHLAAAVPTPSWQWRRRPCVVVAGGREPRSWYGYQHHRILETVGELPCCLHGGCWASHVVQPEDHAGDRLCERVVNHTPKCMAMIRPESVILEIEKYLESQGIE